MGGGAGGRGRRIILSVRPAWLVYIAVLSPVGAKQRDPDSDVFNFPIYSPAGAGLGAVLCRAYSIDLWVSPQLPQGGPQGWRSSRQTWWWALRLTSSKTERVWALTSTAQRWLRRSPSGSLSFEEGLACLAKSLQGSSYWLDRPASSRDLPVPAWLNT